MLCGVWDLIPQPGIKPMPSAVEVQSLNHWTTREVLKGHRLLHFRCLYTVPLSLLSSLTHPVTSSLKTVPVVSQGFWNPLPPDLLLPMALQLASSAAQVCGLSWAEDCGNSLLDFH